MQGIVNTDSTPDPSIYTKSETTAKGVKEGQKPSADQIKDADKSAGGTGATGPTGGAQLKQSTLTGPESPKDAAGVTGSNAGTVTGSGSPGSEAAAGTSLPNADERRI
jgi:hypothetical protein